LNRNGRRRLVLVVASALILGGCGAYGVGGSGSPSVTKVKVTAPFTETGTVQPGTTFTPSGPGTVTVGNQVVEGQFSSKLPSKITLPGKKGTGSAAAVGGIRSVSGRFISRLAGSLNLLTGAGTFSGTKVMRLNGKLGDLCLTWTSNTTNGGNNETGTFRVAGGTKVAATARGGGTYTATKSQNGTTATLTGTVKASGKIGKPAKKPSADCKALAAQL
jgi:hypothetical protein